MNVTCKEAAELMSYTMQAVRYYLKTNQIKGEKINNKWYADKQSVLRFLSRPEKIELLGHKMRKSPDGRVYCIHCQETIKNISKGDLSCQKQ